MSTYEIDRICYRALHDKPFRDALIRDPKLAIAEISLTEDERAAFLAGDVRKLFDMGAHPLLLSRLTRWNILGLSEDIYIERMRNIF